MFRKSWGDRPLLGRLSRFVGLLLLVWLPLAIPIYAWVEDANLASILATGILYLEFLILLKLWGTRVYGRSPVFRAYGLEWSRRQVGEFLGGLLGAAAAMALLVLIQVSLGWMAWQDFPSLRILVEAMGVGLAVGFAEELLFRGWLWDELRRDYSQRKALILNGIIFALLHFIKPPEEIVRTAPQLLGLLLLGVILVQLTIRTQRRLGAAIGFHGGLVASYYLLTVGQMWQPSPPYPMLITGIDGNPLAGLLGLGMLLMISVGLQKLAPR
ncbi:hypothetical protein AY600_02385 [Phormidium willei BDU 130791]|nr:hypothetical protein AY600_02385 [Phormidium willei BDU 130791]